MTWLQLAGWVVCYALYHAALGAVAVRVYTGRATRAWVFWTTPPLLALVVVATLVALPVLAWRDSYAQDEEAPDDR